MSAPDKSNTTCHRCGRGVCQHSTFLDDTADGKTDSRSTDDKSCAYEFISTGPAWGQNDARICLAHLSNSKTDTLTGQKRDGRSNTNHKSKEASHCNDR